MLETSMNKRIQSQNKPTKLLNEKTFKKKLPYFYKTAHDTSCFRTCTWQEGGGVHHLNK